MKFIKTTSILIVCLFCFTMLSAQTSGVITYQETTTLKINTDNMPAGVDISGMIPTDRSVSKQLIFDTNKSIYIDGGEPVEDTEISSDDGSVQITIMTSDIESKLYTSNDENVCLDQQGFMGKAFIIKKPVSKIKWKITTEKVKYLDHECMKATMTDEEGEEVVAWFAPSIPIKAGPDGYGQLPGAILMLSKGDKDLEIKATHIEFKDVGEIAKPIEGEMVTEEEFDKIVEEKMDEMVKEYGGKGIMIKDN